MRHPALQTALAAFGLLLSGCASVPYLEEQPVPSANEGDWAAKRIGAMQAGKLYDGFSTNAFVTAYYQGLAVREARVARLVRWISASAQERDRLLATERDESGRYEDFLVALFTPDPADNDLDAPRSIWRVALVVQGEGEALPLGMHRVRPDSTLRALYPEIGDFDVVYRVRFARWRGGLEGKGFTLRMGGPKGLVDLAYGVGAVAVRRPPR